MNTFKISNITISKKLKIKYIPQRDAEVQKSYTSLWSIGQNCINFNSYKVNTTNEVVDDVIGFLTLQNCKKVANSDRLL